MNRSKQKKTAQALWGSLLALAAVAARLVIPLPLNILPFAVMNIAICFATIYGGLVGGLAATITGGLFIYLMLIRTGLYAALTTFDDWTALVAYVLGYISVALVIIWMGAKFRKSEEKQWLFARELAHRLKNTLAIIQSMVSQTFPPEDQATEKFVGRLQALAAAQSLLTDHIKRPTASLRQIVEAAVRPFDNGHNFEIEGPNLPIRDQNAVMLSMALYELSINASKYGSLSVGGCVHVTWQANDKDTYRLVWRESDGPPVTAPKGQGFGTRLLSRTAMGTTLEFHPEGVRCTIEPRN